jgi:tetraacyldisaccharide 4'-kinase
MIKTPEFWDSKNIISIALLPIAIINIIIQKIFALITKTNNFKNYIICVGNINVGGSGKTPIAIAIGKILQEKNIDFCYLSSGYGRKSTQDIFVRKKQKIDYNQIGDEVVLLSEIGDCYVTNNRIRTLKEISKNFPNKIVIMDDGFQDLSIKKNLNILVVDGKYAFGNKFVFPAGPLRELILTGIKRSDMGIIVNDDKHKIKNLFKEGGKKIFCVKSNIKLKSDKNKEYIAFCGIARAEKFFSAIRDKINVVKEISFKDHHNYSSKELKNLIKQKTKQNNELITTKKDWVKFSEEYRKQIQYVNYEIKFDDEDKKFIFRNVF